MKFITSLILLAAAFVSAKPTGTAECAAIYQRCIETITPQECKKTDRDCLCKAWDDVITCLVDCPNTPRYWLAKENARGFCT
ncbi:hypothetical protein DER46DRAFT_609661 [Fusarium sp. MPI-SDFR-AT-0072]|nr:hypothetical protein DER46DRAFT_609661 [Fusarium sp. MPI-SDFR-AT-0072]